MPIRELMAEDKEFFCQIMDEFYRTDAVIKPLSSEIINRVYEDCINSSPFVKAYIFEDEVPFGYGVVGFGYSNEAGGVCLWVEDLYIRSEYRGKGWGSEFFKMLEREYGKKVRRMRLEVEPDNHSAVGLYRKFGFDFLEYSQMIKEMDQ